jgi:hypothetical protein
LLLMPEEARQKDAPASLHAVSNYLANSASQMDFIGGEVTTTWKDGSSTTNYAVYHELLTEDQANKYVIVEILAQDF